MWSSTGAGTFFANEAATTFLLKAMRWSVPTRSSWFPMHIQSGRPASLSATVWSAIDRVKAWSSSPLNSSSTVSSVTGAKATLHRTRGSAAMACSPMNPPRDVPAMAMRSLKPSSIKKSMIAETFCVKGLTKSSSRSRRDRHPCSPSGSPARTSAPWHGTSRAKLETPLGPSKRPTSLISSFVRLYSRSDPITMIEGARTGFGTPREPNFTPERISIMCSFSLMATPYPPRSWDSVSSLSSGAEPRYLVQFLEKIS